MKYTLGKKLFLLNLHPHLKPYSQSKKINPQLCFLWIPTKMLVLGSCEQTLHWESSCFHILLIILEWVLQILPLSLVINIIKFFKKQLKQTCTKKKKGNLQLLPEIVLDCKIFFIKNKWRQHAKYITVTYTISELLKYFQKA